MMDQIDLKLLATRESEQVEWKENVPDADDVVETISAFANDWPNLGGGYVVCGARETKDEHGFPLLQVVGLTANRFKETEGKVLTACRDRVDPPLTPLVQELSSSTMDRRGSCFHSSGYEFSPLVSTQRRSRQILRQNQPRDKRGSKWNSPGTPSSERGA